MKSSLLPYSLLFFFNDTATTEIYTLSLHDALPILSPGSLPRRLEAAADVRAVPLARTTTLPATAAARRMGPVRIVSSPRARSFAVHRMVPGYRVGTASGQRERKYAVTPERLAGVLPENGLAARDADRQPTPAYQRCVVAPEVW